MKLPEQLPAGACWLILPNEATMRDAWLPDSTQWRLTGRAGASFALQNFDAPEQASAAVRLLGEAMSPLADAEWCAAIDPVTLAADMRDVRIQVWPQHSIDADSAGQLIDGLSELLREDDDARLRRLRIIQATPSRWYLVGRAEDAIEFSVAPAARLLGEPLRHHKPEGPDGRLVQRLSTEIQMHLHQHPVNATREAAGLPAVNAVWLWGGGVLPSQEAGVLPPLISSDPFWRGCWRLIANTSAIATPAVDEPVPHGSVVAAGNRDAAWLVPAVFASPAISTVYVAARDGMDIYQRRGGLGRLMARFGKQQ